MPLNTELLNKVADSLRKNPNAMMGSRWIKRETETIATQAIISCDYNFKESNDAFTWAGKGLSQGKVMVNNAGGLITLVSEGSIVIEDYDGNLTPPTKTLHKNGVPQILRVTNELLKYAEELIG